MTVMTHPLRRKILTLLVEQRELTRPELAAILADDPDVSATDPKYLEIVLHHNHLPKLADKSFIDYDSRTGDINRWEEPEAIKSQLNRVTFDE